MPHATPLIATLVASFVLAFAFGALAHKLRLPPLVGYLLAGVAIGPGTPGFVADLGVASELAEIGVILLMFGVGLHFSLRDLLSVKTIAIPGAILQIAIATAMGYGTALLLGWSDAAGLVFGLALSVASTVVLLKALEERRLLDTDRGRIAIGWLVVEDLAMVAALVLIPAVAGPADSDAARTSIWSALGITAMKLIAFGVVMLVVGRRVIPAMLERAAASGSRELFRLAVLAIALGVAFGAAHLFGVSFALGAFFAGMILNESPLSHDAASDSLPLRDAFSVLFFVSVGMLFNPTVLLEQPLGVALAVAIIVVGKSLAALLLVLAFRHPLGTALTIAVSLAQIGEFSFILAALGTDLEILPPQGRDLILAGAIVSIMLNPLLFALIRRASSVRESAVGERDAALAQSNAGGPALAGHVLLVGYGRVGRRVAKGLVDAEQRFVVIELEAGAVQAARTDGHTVIRGDATRDRVMNDAAADRAAIALLAIPDALAAGHVAQRLRSSFPQLPIIARAHGAQDSNYLLEHGADAALIAEFELADSMRDTALAALRGRKRLDAMRQEQSAEEPPIIGT